MLGNMFAKKDTVTVFVTRWSVCSLVRNVDVVSSPASTTSLT